MEESIIVPWIVLEPYTILLREYSVVMYIVDISLLVNEGFLMYFYVFRWDFVMLMRFNSCMIISWLFCTRGSCSNLKLILSFTYKQSCDNNFKLLIFCECYFANNGWEKKKYNYSFKVKHFSNSICIIDNFKII